MTKVILIVFWTMSNSPAGPMVANFTSMEACQAATTKISADLKNTPFSQMKILSINCFEDAK